MSGKDTTEILAASDPALMAAFEDVIACWASENGLRIGVQMDPDMGYRVALAVDWLHAKYGSGSE
jgi:hypothetical protein